MTDARRALGDLGLPRFGTDAGQTLGATVTAVRSAPTVVVLARSTPLTSSTLTIESVGVSSFGANAVHAARPVTARPRKQDFMRVPMSAG